jgi:hypothetical protein
MRYLSMAKPSMRWWYHSLSLSQNTTLDDNNNNAFIYFFSFLIHPIHKFYPLAKGFLTKRSFLSFFVLLLSLPRACATAFLFLVQVCNHHHFQPWKERNRIDS